MYYLVFFSIMFSGMLVFCFMHKHILLALLSIEFMVLGLYYGFFYFLSTFDMMMYFILVFLTFSVCEGALGLGVLVSLIRSHGNDNISSLSFIVW
uniref:NADH-ubiquinone oxidoreductase chain 4L n=1 Tax=Phymata americana TaxID=1347736 RepID=A0A342CF69_9HEMI|nr:NADH dehydrogenase subunit 4L [Phymata americana]AGO27996.1 NADH dehydrogenase subunit 4L [Phymata americana]